MRVTIRKATKADEADLSHLLQTAVTHLLGRDYPAEKIALSLGSIFAVPTKLIEEGTFYVALGDGEILACGGWSAPPVHTRKSANALMQAARLHAFFVAPHAVRRGIARRVLEQCEAAVFTAGISGIAMFSTLTAAPFYRACGYHEAGQSELPLPGVSGFPVIIMQKELRPLEAH